jgi:2-polyprenyl-6-hydroxyphenyl methylase/3-demethylubiquinone-9 3-methyltransferase
MIHPMNADPLELQKFSDLAHRWWDPTSEFRPLHEINPLRLEWINARAPLRGKKVLDIGCGGGILAESMAKKGANVTGIDLSEKALKVADLHSLETGVSVRYELIAAEALAAREPAGFDVVTCMEMLEHVPDPAAIVQACATLVKPGGHVFFSTLNRNPKSYLFAVIGAEYLLRLLPKGTHDYAKFITPAELAQYARNAGLGVDALKGMGYNPLTQMYSLNQDTSVNYLVATTRAA